MSDTGESTAADRAVGVLETARERLEASLRRLSTAASDLVAERSADGADQRAELDALKLQLGERDAELAALRAEPEKMEDMLRSAKAGIADKNELKARVAKLETENLALHEQVASHALTSPDGDGELRAALASLRADKKMLEDRYASLKKDFAALEAQGGPTAANDTDAAEGLKQKIVDFERERDDIRQTLDLGIARLEGVLKEGNG